MIVVELVVPTTCVVKIRSKESEVRRVTVVDASGYGDQEIRRINKGVIVGVVGAVSPMDDKEETSRQIAKDKSEDCASALGFATTLPETGLGLAAYACPVQDMGVQGVD